jgi:hypothetical protein
LLLPLPSAFPDISDVTDHDLDEDELKVFIKECTDFIGPFKSEDGEKRLQSQFLFLDCFQ